ncbi:MAG TPA: malto-oligosyltrehalose synthase [Thermoanaerobaculia bacterium]|nr:malto-oligosyltrehalose synthase [Thermoanaerobaculia bacterium]
MPRTPLATYRVQLRPGFGFDEAAAIAPYLAALGVSHLYSSPYLQAAKGSTHGYDVVDPTRVNEELGGAEAHAQFCRTLGENGLGQVLDIVPNHMAITEPQNLWWWDVLENGPSSRYAAYFDVDWDPPQERFRNTVVLPILGDHYGRVLEAGEMKLVRSAGSFEIHYFDHRMPVSPRSLDSLLGEAAERCGSADLAFLGDVLGQLPLATATDLASVVRRHRDKEVVRGQLARLFEEQPGVARAVDAVLEEINRDPDRLDALLSRQNYRPAFWRTAGRELDYRRFFDVHTLAGLRTEDERVFADTHGLVLDWVRRGVLDGLRIDHPDGLRDPEQYFERLRAAAPGAWVVVEKILEPGERLHGSWPVDGTTGYDFLNVVGGLFVDPGGERPLTDLYADLTGPCADYPELVWQKKHLVLEELLAAEVNRIAEVFLQVCERHRCHRDYMRNELRAAVREVAACFPVYRSYVRAEAGKRTPEDEEHVSVAIEAARSRRPDLPSDLFDFFRDLLLLKVRGPGESQPESELVMRFQQLTGPAMAKGVEDTAFYNYHRLIALNEVGGDPGRFGISPEEVHRILAEAQDRWPHTQLATSTHDTKRSEDVRARLALLSEIPEKWAEAVRRWIAHNNRPEILDKNAEYLLYQTLVGAWPIEADRVTAYMEKASREAKGATSWTRIDPDYEETLRSFIETILDDPGFVADLEGFVAPLVEPGRINSLAQALVKLTAPGVPDLYQGTELWSLSLVDPDNRRPVDYEERRRLLEELRGEPPPEDILARMDEGLPKLWVTRQALRLRRFLGEESGYTPLTAKGEKAAHAFAFSRGDAVVTIVPRLVIGLGKDWGDTLLEIPPGPWRNELTGEEIAGGEVRLAGLFRRFPVALLSRLA